MAEVMLDEAAVMTGVESKYLGRHVHPAPLAVDAVAASLASVDAPDNDEGFLLWVRCVWLSGC